MQNDGGMMSRMMRFALVVVLCGLGFVALASMAVGQRVGCAPVDFAAGEKAHAGRDGSAYIAVDSWVYPAMLRLYSMGYVDGATLSMRPWTRQAALHLLQGSQARIAAADDVEAQGLLDILLRELRDERAAADGKRCGVFGVEQTYVRALGIAGPSLRDSYHLGQTLVNDYGRPYEAGFNTVNGAAVLAERGRFSIYARGEFEHAPGGEGYPAALADQLSGVDLIARTGANAVQSTIPAGPVAGRNSFHLLEASASVHVLGHELSVGKSDAWLGPARGGAFAWSNNAENIYGVRVNRVEPLRVPLLSRVLGPLRYDFFYGSLQGHTAPNHPYVHSEMFAFKPTRNFEFAFQRTIIFGGAAHEPVTLHTFLRGFVALGDTTPAQKDSVADPGARFSVFSFSYRLPALRRYATFYTDSMAHDDVTPVSAPRRASFRTGIYVAQIPGARRLSIRVEAALTDPRVTVSNGGRFNYFESVQRQGYTNKGFLMGDWIGREAKGGQAWVTWHLSGNEWVEVEYLRKKNAKDFILGGTTQNSVKVSMMKRVRRDFEVNAWCQVEGWKAPVSNKDTGVPLYRTGLQQDTAAALQIVFYPRGGVR